ncbi:unnamed protein product [Adineta steineri]|uniref:DUF1275 domain protein n=1 Tax=Adineta steineri TaxID=433720 RepID=A0A814S1L0_9BILA|nr:unnamed protein product [Adineta steineri]CAF3946951.1 unnamed protein product [Adineta steineri]
MQSASSTLNIEYDSNEIRSSCLSRIIAFFRDDIDTKHVDLQLMAFGFGTGVVDVMSYKDFGVFVSNQTGNTVFFGARIAGQSSAVYSLICASLFGFLISGFISGQIGHRIGNKRRWWLICNTCFQTILIFVVIVLMSKKTILPKDSNAYVLALLLSISYGCQMAMAKHLSCPEIPTAVLTSPFMDLLTDPKLFKRHNIPRNRRFFYILLFLVGIIVGSFSYKEMSSEFTLGIAGVVKALVAISFFFNPKTNSQSEPSE